MIMSKQRLAADSAHVLYGLGDDDLWSRLGHVDSAAGSASSVDIAEVRQDLARGEDHEVIVSAVEGLQGTARGDASEGENREGDEGENWLEGGAGNDVLSGLDGADVLLGGAGNDVLYGGAGSDNLYGEDGNDILWGGTGGAVIDGENLNGGAGIDTVCYGDSAEGVIVDLSTGQGHHGTAEEDHYDQIENVVGSDQGDTLVGNGDANRLTGGQGKDVLRGGGGADCFAYATTDDSAQENSDLIQDFSQVQGDKIDLSAIDADEAASGDQWFTFVGTETFIIGAAGQLRYEWRDGDTLVQGDTDGDGQADFEIALEGQIALTGRDFVL
ncbi:calcium-binding protein [Inquilinus sp. CA228]|uniref:calcium-binding protein n=1 Tax=Inquilinus sp. CA228 TaxID=3455609 RepID=UPI003F8D2CA2